MEAVVGLTEPDLYVELHERIAVLEAEVLKERAARELAEKQRDDVCHELVVLRTQADRLGELVRLKPTANISAPAQTPPAAEKDVPTETDAPIEPPADLVQLDIPDIEAHAMPPSCTNEAPAELAPSLVTQKACTAPLAASCSVPMEPEATVSDDRTTVPAPTVVPADMVAPDASQPAAPLIESPQPIANAVFPVSVSAPAPETDLTSVAAVEPTVTAPEPVEAIDPVNLRAAARVATNMTASYWRSGMQAARACTICDKSSGGARLDLAQASASSHEKALAQGDQITLTFESPFERTSVACLIMWIKGAQCGVRYAGQFHTDMKQQHAPRRKEPSPPPKAKGGMFSGRR